MDFLKAEIARKKKQIEEKGVLVRKSQIWNTISKILLIERLQMVSDNMGFIFIRYTTQDSSGPLMVYAGHDCFVIQIP